MSFDINAEIAIRRQDVLDQLNDANPSVEPLVEAIENELEFTFDTMFDSFDEMFLDNGIAVGTYDGLSEADEETIIEWQNDMLNKAIHRWQRRLASRVYNLK